MSINNEKILLSSTKYLEHKDYWKAILENYNNENYFKNYKECHTETFNMVNKKFKVDTEIVNKLICNSKNNDMSLFAILLAVLNITMYKYSGNDTLVVSVPCSKKRNNRNSFIPIKQSFNEDMLLKDCVIELSNILKNAYIHREYPVEELNLHSDYPAVTFQFKGLDIFECEDMRYSQINFIFQRDNNKLNCEIIYNAEVFNETHVNYIFEYYCNALEIFVLDSSKVISEVNLLKGSDKEILLDVFNSSKITFEDKSVTDYLDYHFKNNPTKIVINDGNQQLSYKDLFKRSNQWVNFLLMKGIQQGDRIAILLDRSVEYFIAIVSILRVGATYVPLDYGMPIERINYIIDNSEAKILLLSEKIDKSLIKKEKICVYENEHFKFSKKLEHASLPRINSSGVAYIIYTSGTTGLPKGVMISHKSIVNLILGFKEKIYSNLEEDICFGFVSPFCFDASIQGIFGAIILGFKLYLISKEVRLDMNKLMKAIRYEHINVIDGTPMDLKLMITGEHTELHCLKLLLIGGEPLSKSIIEQFNKKFNSEYKIYNLYGPTETTVDATYLNVNDDNLSDYDETLPIGYPFPNKKIYILDKNQQLLPIGCVGEIYVSGEGIMNGYINTDSNSKCLMRDPFYPEYTMYKTGDFGYWRTDGIIGYIGRKDNQIKIDGYRIELDEIEVLLNKNPDIKDAIVLVEKNEDYNILSCYFVADEKLVRSRIIDCLKTFVSEYMIPKKIVQVSEIPYNINGKVDRKKLLNLKYVGEDKKVTLPRDHREKEILEQLQHLMKNENIGIEDNFFQIGGNSLKALQFVILLKNIGIELKLIDIFTNQTIKQLYDMIKKRNDFIINDIRQAEIKLNEEFGFEFCYLVEKVDKKNYSILKCDNFNINVDELTQYMLDNFEYSIIPHYIITSSELELFRNKILNSSLLSADSLCDNIYGDILKKWKEYEESIRNNKIEKTYSINMQQKMMLNLGVDNSGTNIIIDRPLNLKKFQSAFNKLIIKHPLLRSEFILKNCKYSCNQFCINGDIENIPVVDLSWESIENQNIIIKKLINLLYFEKVKVCEHLLYKAILIKRNQKEYILSLPAHHSIFDGMSGEVIKKSLLELYDGQSDNSILHYSDYSQNIYNEMLKFDYSFALEKLGLNLFKRFFNEKVYNKNLYQSQVFEIDVQNIDEVGWEFALGVFQSFLFEIFSEQQVPVYIMNYGRHYKTKDYFDYFGIFIDLIPCIFNRTSSINELTEQVKSNIEYSVDNNINFVNTILNDENIFNTPIGDLQLYKEPIILFNFQGKTDENNYELRNSLDKKSSNNNISKATFNGIYVETVYTNSKIKFTIESTVEINNFVQKVKKIKSKFFYSMIAES